MTPHAPLRQASRYRPRKGAALPSPSIFRSFAMGVCPWLRFPADGPTAEPPGLAGGVRLEHRLAVLLAVLHRVHRLAGGVDDHLLEGVLLRTAGTRGAHGWEQPS